MGVGAKCQGNAGECKGMPGERMAVGANSQGNARERKKNARGTYGSECKVPGECRGMTRESTGVGVKC